MLEETLTIDVQGSVSLDDFASVIGAFRTLINALTTELVGKGAITWELDDLQYGSAIATVRGANLIHPDGPERVARGYIEVGLALQHFYPIPYGEQVQRAAHEVATKIRRSITGIRFETKETDAVIPKSRVQQPPPPMVMRLGRVRGQVEAMSRRRTLRFTLYDSIFDRPVSCYLAPEQHAQMLDIWGKRVVVDGLVGRDPMTFYPVTVRQISRIKILEDVPVGTYALARGILTPHTEEPPELRIRRMRDEQ